MIGIADAKLLNLGMVLCRNGMALTFSFYLSWKIRSLHIGTKAGISIFVFYSLTLGQNSRASTSISSIAKMLMRSSSLICLLAVIVAYRENRWLHLWCTASTSSENSELAIYKDLRRGIDGDSQIS